jgi:RNA polymerase sigma-70 factor (ECF subfamily)
VGARPAEAADPRADLSALYDVALPQAYLLSRYGERALAEDLTAECFLAAVTAARSPMRRRSASGG